VQHLCCAELLSAIGLASKKWCHQSTPKIKLLLLLVHDGSRRSSGSEFQAIGTPTEKSDGRMYFVDTAVQSDNVDWRSVSAVEWRRRRPECSSRPGALCSADTGAPELWACTALVLEHRASAVHRAAMMSDHRRTSCECRWREALRRSAHVVACQLRAEVIRQKPLCSSPLETLRRRGVDVEGSSETSKLTKPVKHVAVTLDACLSRLRSDEKITPRNVMFRCAFVFCCTRALQRFVYKCNKACYY